MQIVDCSQGSADWLTARQGIPTASRFADFVTCAFVWVKQNPKAGGIYSGMGHWTNQNAELCLLARRGKPRRVARDVKQVVLAPRGRHSAKPAEVRDRIVRLMGDVPRVELFARERVQGWEAWGNEIEANNKPSG